jgi:hypothetical protein
MIAQVVFLRFPEQKQKISSQNTICVPHNTLWYGEIVFGFDDVQLSQLEGGPIIEPGTIITIPRQVFHSRMRARLITVDPEVGPSSRQCVEFPVILVAEMESIESPQQHHQLSGTP